MLLTLLNCISRSLLLLKLRLLSKKRDDKIAYIRDPKNFAKPWTKTQIDAELEAKKHKLDHLRAKAAEAAAAGVAAAAAVEAPVETEIVADDAGDDEDAEPLEEDAQIV